MPRRTSDIAADLAAAGARRRTALDDAANELERVVDLAREALAAGDLSVAEIARLAGVTRKTLYDRGLRG